MPQPVLPPSASYVLRHARLHHSLAGGPVGDTDPDGFALVDIAITGGRISAITPAVREPRPQGAVELGGRIVFPCFVDCHTHLDKGHIWPRRPNPDGTFASALAAVAEDRAARWRAEDVRRRMEFGLRAAYAHGTAAIRTHLDSIAPQEAISWPVFERLREEWRGRITLQAACLLGIEEFRDMDCLRRLARRVAAAGGALGAVTYMVPDLDDLLGRVFRAAAEHGLDLDFHADETDDRDAISLERIATAALAHGFAGRILVGHCCSLALQPGKKVLDTLDKVARAGLAVVSLPMCNLYLQDRRNDGTTPRWRGVTLLHEMKARGIEVAVASDNTRDPFHAYGDLDMLEVFRMATRILHLDHPVADWPRTVAAAPAAIMGLGEAGRLAPGGPADLVIFRGRNWTELLSRPESERLVVRSGRVVEARVPDYSELDDLMV
jgi:cytosine deaminase